MIYEDIVSKV